MEEKGWLCIGAGGEQRKERPIRSKERLLGRVDRALLALALERDGSELLLPCVIRRMRSVPPLVCCQGASAFAL